MGVFVCDNCNCVENTALGHYWGRGTIKFKDSSKNGKALCSACTPKEFDDGSKDERFGQWHGHFPKIEWDGKREVKNR